MDARRAPLPPLDRDESCIRAWRTSLAPSIHWDGLMDALERRRFTSTRATGPLRALRSPEGHEVILVPATGRVQLRVHYMTPELDRRHTAENLWRDLVLAMRDLT